MQEAGIAPVSPAAESIAVLLPDCLPLCLPDLCLPRLLQVGDLSAFVVEPRSTRAVLGRAGGGLMLFDLKLGKPSSSVSCIVDVEEHIGHRIVLCWRLAGWLAMPDQFAAHS